VDADLVGAAGFEAALDEGKVLAEGAKGADVGDGEFGVEAVDVMFGGALWEGLAFAGGRVFVEVGAEGSGGAVAGDDGVVKALDVVVGKHLDELLFGGAGAGEDHEAGGVAVEPVDGDDGGERGAVRAARFWGGKKSSQRCGQKLIERGLFGPAGGGEVVFVGVAGGDEAGGFLDDD
jgi:hypothetical protein